MAKHKKKTWYYRRFIDSIGIYFELAIASYLFDTIPLVGKICDVVVVMTVVVLIISSMSIFRKAKISRN